MDSEAIYTAYYPRASSSPGEFKPKLFVGGFVSWLNGESSSAAWWVPTGIRILDVGCGFGEALAYHRARGCEVFGVELDENVREVADRFNFNVHLGPFDPDGYVPGSFDFVTMHQVMEHLRDPLAVLGGVKKILRSGGHLIISTPNAGGWGSRVFGRRWINWHLPYHRQFFTKDSLRLAAEAVGLEVERVRVVTSSDWLKYQWVHLLFCPPEGTPSAFWSPRAGRGYGIRITERLLELLHWLRINHLLTRFFDALGKGDNFVFVLRKP